MRTGQLLTVFGGGGICLVPGGVPAWSWGVGYLPGCEGVYLPGPGGVPAWSRVVPAWSGGVPAWSGGVPGQVLPPVDRMTHTCKNITLAKTSFWPVNITVRPTLAQEQARKPLTFIFI